MPTSPISSVRLYEDFEGGRYEPGKRRPQVAGPKEAATGGPGTPTPSQGSGEEFLCAVRPRPLQPRKAIYPSEDDYFPDYTMTYSGASEDRARDLPITPGGEDMTYRRCNGKTVARTIPLVPMSPEETARSHENIERAIPRQWGGGDDVDYSLKSPEAYAKPFCEFLTENPTVWHAVAYFEKKLKHVGFKKVCLFLRNPVVILLTFQALGARRLGQWIVETWK